MGSPRAWLTVLLLLSVAAPAAGVSAFNEFVGTGTVRIVDHQGECADAHAYVRVQYQLGEWRMDVQARSVDVGVGSGESREDPLVNDDSCWLQGGLNMPVDGSPETGFASNAEKWESLYDTVTIRLGPPSGETPLFFEVRGDYGYQARGTIDFTPFVAGWPR